MPKLPEAARALGGAEEELWRLRVEYAELGRLAMLSHLEVARFLERVVRRAGLPYAVTHGFSPHMRIAFGGALPVGVGGLHEIFDVFLRERVNEQVALDALQQATVPQMPMNACAYIGRREPAASVALPVSCYEATFDGPCEGLAVPDEVVVVRKGKEKRLCPADFMVAGPVAEGCTLRFTLQAKDTGSLRPDVLLEAMTRDTQLAIQSIMRTSQHAQAAR